MNKQNIIKKVFPLLQEDDEILYIPQKRVFEFIYIFIVSSFISVFFIALSYFLFYLFIEWIKVFTIGDIEFVDIFSALYLILAFVCMFIAIFLETYTVCGFFNNEIIITRKNVILFRYGKTIILKKENISGIYFRPTMLRNLLEGVKIMVKKDNISLPNKLSIWNVIRDIYWDNYDLLYYDGVELKEKIQLGNRPF